MEKLTPRQLEILAHYGSGKSQIDIAAECFISTRTVEHTLRNARSIAAAGNNVQLLVRAIADEQLILSHGGSVLVPERTR